MNHRLFALMPVALLVAACATDAPTAPASSPEFAAVKFWDAGATVAWNARAEAMAAAVLPPAPIDGLRISLYLSMAQFRAAEAARAAGGPHPPVSAAIGGASAVVLTSFFPGSAPAIEAALDAQQASEKWPGDKHSDFAVGEAIGRAIGARVLAYAQTDLVGLTNPLLPPYGPPPSTPGSYIIGAVLARGNLGARPFFLASGSQLRPAAPPAFMSAAFAAALDEVRQIALTRTTEQTRIANFWNVNQSPRSTAAMNSLARELVVSHRLKDAEAARTFFLMSAAAHDALIGCFDAKYTYWLIRPAQADPSIVTTFPTPPHPSYPSAHSCISGASTAVLATVFPDARARVEAIAAEAGMSRVYAGIHYRFDSETGLALGRAAAALAVAADLDAVALLP